MYHKHSRRRRVWLSGVAVFASVSAAILLTSLTASAADIDPARFEVTPPAPVDRWNGFYAGVSVNGLATASEVGVPSRTIESDNGSVLPGVHLGYNFGRSASGWMAGVEIDAVFGEIDQNKTDAILGRTEVTGNFIGSARGRAGYAWDNIFLYGTAGLAFTDYALKPVNASGTDVKAGLAYGIGLEAALSENWSARAEVLAYEFGDRTETFNGTRRDVDFNLGTFRFGLSRKF